MDLPSAFNNDIIDSSEYSQDAQLDTIKSKVSTSPLKRGGANFKTNVLVQKSSSKYVYKPATGAALFAFLFLAIGLGVIFFNAVAIFKSSFDFSELNWGLMAFGLIFTSAGGIVFYNFYMPRVFDKQLGLYYKTYRPKIHFRDKKSSKTHVLLKSIVAIQLIGEHVKSDKNFYKSFELNLVLDDATRKNVVDHGNLKSIISDAEILSAFLDVPIWHAGSHKD